MNHGSVLLGLSRRHQVWSRINLVVTRGKRKNVGVIQQKPNVLCEFVSQGGWEMEKKLWGERLRLEAEANKSVSGGGMRKISKTSGSFFCGEGVGVRIGKGSWSGVFFNVTTKKKGCVNPVSFSHSCGQGGVRDIVRRGWVYRSDQSAAYVLPVVS